MSSLFAIKEKLPKLEEHADLSMSELMIQCYHLCEELNVIKTLRAMTVTIDKMTETKHVNHYYLINIDFIALRVNVQVYSKSQLPNANDRYIDLEKSIDNSKNAVVLVSATNVRALKKAYPSYFLDPSEFIHALERIQRNCIDRGLIKV